MGRNFHAIAYDRKAYREYDVQTAGDLRNGEPGEVTWLDIPTGDAQAVADLCGGLGVHRLIVEDILNTRQMVKVDDYEDCLFIVLKMIRYDTQTDTIRDEHVCIIVKNSLVLSFQEEGRNIFARVREKISSEGDSIRKFGADYLFYELVNTVVDNYFHIIDELGDVADDIEEEMIADPVKGTLQRIYFIKRELMFLRKSVYPLRGLIGDLSNCTSPMLGDGVRIYLRDVYDHLIQIVDSIETYQDIMSNMLDTYLSSISNKTNDTMKILTIFSTIFIPLTFLAGIYGMNFRNIPELGFRYGYLFFWIACALIAGVMLLYFHRKKWF